MSDKYLPYLNTILLAVIVVVTMLPSSFAVVDEDQIRNKLVEYWKFNNATTGEKAKYEFNASTTHFTDNGKFNTSMICFDSNDDQLWFQSDIMGNYTFCGFYNYSSALEDNKAILAMTSSSPGSNYHMGYTQPTASEWDNTFYQGVIKGRTTLSNAYDTSGFTFLCIGAAINTTSDKVISYVNDTFQEDSGTMNTASQFNPMYFTFLGSDKVYNPAGGAYRVAQGCMDEGMLFNTILSEEELSFLRNRTAEFDPFGAGPVEITNSSWNVTSDNVLAGTSAAWNTGNFVNISSNLVSLTVTASTSSNMSCSIGNDINYTTMVALNSNFKSATTETTSHAMTIFDNISVSSSCLYCSFIDVNGDGERTDSHSGCLEIRRTDVPASIGAVEFNMSDTTFASESFTPIDTFQFNTTETHDIIILNALNVQKQSGTGTNAIRLRFLLDGTDIITETVRTVTGTSSLGSTGLSPVKTLLISGQHNLTLEAARNGTGTIGLSNIDIVLMIATDAEDNDFVKTNLTMIEASHSSNTFEEAFNFTMVKFSESSNYLFWNIIAKKITSGTAEISYLMRDNTDGDLSPIATRALADANDIGALANTHIDTPEAVDHTHTILARNTDIGDTVTINGTIFDMDLRDNRSHLINSLFVSNPLTNDSFVRTLGAGTHQLVNGSISIRDGDSIILTATSSFQSTTGSQTPRFFIEYNGEQAQKQRTLSSSADIGNMYMFDQIISTQGENISLSLNVEISAGNTLEIIDESLTAFESETFSIQEVDILPPVITLISPANESGAFSPFNITFSAIDNSNNDLICQLNQIASNFSFDTRMFYRFEEISGEVIKDETTNNFDGEFFGNAKYHPSKGSNNTGDNAIYFDGNDFILGADDDLLSFGNSITDSPFSIGAWLFMNSSNRFRIISKQRDASNAEWIFTTTAGDVLLFQMYDGGASDAIGRSYSVPLSGMTNTWIYITMVYDGTGVAGGIKLYINGTQVDDTLNNAGSYVAMHNTPAVIELGSINNGTTTNTIGMIDEGFILGTNISQADILSIIDDGIANVIDNVFDSQIITQDTSSILTYNGTLPDSFNLQCWDNTQNNNTAFTGLFYDTDVTPPNLTVFLPANLSFFQIDSDTVNMTANCTDDNPLLINVSISNATSLIFTDSDAPTEISTSYAVTGVGPGNYSVEFICEDTAGLLDSEIRTVTFIETTPVSVTLVSPADNANITVSETLLPTSVSMSYDVNLVTNCSLFLNGTFQLSQNSTNLSTNSFAQSFNNGTQTWNIECINGLTIDTSVNRTFNVLSEPAFTGLFSLEDCTGYSTADILIMGILVILTLFFIAFGAISGIGFIGFFGALLLMVLTWYLGPCQPLFAFILAAFSMVLLIYFVIVVPLGFVNKVFK